MLPSNYAYTSGKIRALETKILNQTDIERMVDAPDFATAFKVLNDTDYADNLLEVEPINYRDALRDDYQQLYNLLKKITPDPRLFKLIFLERDLVNIKFLFKAKYLGVNVDNLLKKESVIYPPNYLKEFIFNRKDLGLDQETKDLIIEAESLLTESRQPDFIDLILTKGYFALSQKLAKKIGNQLIISLVKIQINNANLLTWLRAKRLNLDKAKIAEKFIPGGDLDLQQLVQLYSEETRNIRPIFNKYYDRQVAESYDSYCERNLLFELEKALENFKTRYAQKTKMVAFGPEVVMAYHLAKQIAVGNMVIIMTGKFNKIPGEEIKKTLREIY